MNKKHTISEKRDLLLDFLANKELSLGCSVFIQNYIVSVLITGDNRGKCIVDDTEFTDFLGLVGSHTQPFTEKHITKIIGHKVMIGDVLDEIRGQDNLRQLMVFWNKCGFTKSLNEILDSEIERDYFELQLIHDGRKDHDIFPVYKDKDIQNLAKFLWDLFGEPITNKTTE